ncbi:hypothetical protein ATCC90586_011829 [Pythium insidiosum]|nr:hypothetical protein ATCC90586_011829 [Pythium insidiosum]
MEPQQWKVCGLALVLLLLGLSRTPIAQAVVVPLSNAASPACNPLTEFYDESVLGCGRCAPALPRNL